MHEGIVVDSWEVGDVDVKREKRQKHGMYAFVSNFWSI